TRKGKGKAKECRSPYPLLPLCNCLTLYAFFKGYCIRGVLKGVHGREFCVQPSLEYAFPSLKYLDLHRRIIWLVARRRKDVTVHSKVWKKLADHYFKVGIRYFKFRF